MPLASVDSSFLAVLTAAVLVSGYVVLWALWKYGFKHRRVDPTEGVVEQPLNRSGRGFVAEIERYETWLRKQGEFDPWTEVAVFEHDRSQPGLGAWERGAEVAAAEFAGRFDEILRTTQRDAIDLSARDVYRERLIVAVEWESRPETPATPRRAVLPVWVEYRGF